MTKDTRPWVGFGDSLRLARVEHKLRLIDIGGFSAPYLSRVERNLTVPNEAIATRYEQATGVRGLVDTYRQILANLGSAGQLVPDSSSSYFESGYIVEELDTSLRFGETVRVLERRKIRALVPGLMGLRIRQGLFERDGVTPTLKSITALDAHLDSVEWITKNYFAINLSLPEALAPGQLFAYTIEYEFNFLFPRYTFQPLVQARRFSLMLQLPDDRWDVFEVRGVADMVIDDLRRGIWSAQTPGVARLALNRFSAVRCEYSGLIPGLLYGMIWE